MSKLSSKFSIGRLSAGGGLALLTLIGTGLSAIAQPTEQVKRGQARQLADLAFGYAIAEQSEKAISLLEQAETYAGGDCFEANVWLKIGVGYRTVGQLEKGEDFLTQARDMATKRDLENCAGSGTTPGESLLNRSLEYAEAGHLDLAAHVAEQVNSFFAPITLVKIANDFYEDGQERKANSIVADAIELAAELGAEQEAKQDTEALDQPNYRDRLLMAMATHLIQQDNFEAANFVVEEGNLIQRLSSDELDSTFQNYERLDRAKLLISLGESEQALAIINEVVANIQALDVPLDEVSEWIDAAVLYSELGSAQAAEVFAAAEASLSQHSENSTRQFEPDEVQIAPNLTHQFAQNTIVRGYAEVGKFDQAKELAASINDVQTSQTAYTDIATAYARAGQVEEATRVAESIGLEQFSLTPIMWAYLETEQYVQAQQIAEQIGELSSVGSALCEIGQPEGVLPIIDLLSESDPERAGWLRSCAAIEFAKQHQFDRATALAESVTSTDRKVNTLIAIAAQHNLPVSSFWARWAQRISRLLQIVLGNAPESSEAVILLDKAHKLIQS
ncbi:hypothetical protein S7335_676 [Synechococcus sp. PCC 7335]|uniref:hypothetical protein n=1 Tax=Synechococcus sp. (strain ATCC 29403 / PCC 7335) TaxID=91464 RepID=UPI00017ED2A2|nr:hypothetical protein [Synechococcus sp. PCC 7335]EDX83496.1 hypothetical protein S7335_676 [Synechococcus sp. PCC 7335]